MISYGKKEMEALALIEPVNINRVNIDTEAYIRKAHKLRSEFLTDLLSSFYQATVVKYRKSREIQAAKNALYTMSDHELSDIGVFRSEIEQAVAGTKKMETTVKEGFLASLVSKYVEAQKARTAYVHLMAMNSRELADIGLTRGEIAAAVNSNSIGRANDNQAQASNTNNHRQAV